MINMKKFLLTLYIFVIFAFTFLLRIQAKDFELLITRDVFVDEISRIKIIETHTVKNNSQTEFISIKNSETFQINHIKQFQDKLKQSVDTAILKIDGKQVQFTTEYNNEVAQISIDYPRAIGTNDKLTFVLEYYNYGLLANTGALYDLYISGLSKEGLLSTEKQELSYDTNIYIKKGVLPELDFALPSTTTINNDGANGYNEYKYNMDALLGESVWMQFGKEQFYKFKIVQPALPTMENNLGLQNEYKIIVPRDIVSAETTQKVFIDKIFPIPSKTEKDSEGNFFAYFNIASSESEDITIEGYTQVGLTGVNISAEKSGVITDYNQDKIQEYLSGAEYWEVSSSEIQAKAKELKGAETNVFKIINATYNFVINKIDYNEIKRFGVNERQGALATLRNGSGVCMEYSDLFLTLLRAQGIPARAVFGYGYDPLINNTAQEAHQWVQVLIPASNEWLDVDVTWGESKDMAKGGILNHFYTHISRNNPEEHSEVVLSSFGNTDILELPKYEISAISKLPTNVIFLSQEDLLNKYPYMETTSAVDYIMKLPQKINALFKNVENRDTLSVILLGVGMILILVPATLIIKDKIYFGKKNEPTS
jgi:transglutaminase/protease-like cytokinesis protein 3